MAWQVNPDGTRDHLQGMSPLEMFDRDPLMARRVFEFQRAMRLAPMLQQAALRHMYGRPGDVDSGSPVVQPFLELQDRARKAGFDPARATSQGRQIDQALAERALLTGADPLGEGKWMMSGGTLTAAPRQPVGERAGRAVQDGQPRPVLRRGASGVLSPGAGNYGVFSVIMQQLGLPGSGLIPGKGAVTVQDAVAAAQRLGQGGAEIPDVPIPEIQALRQRRARSVAQQQAQAAQAAQAGQAQARAQQGAVEHQRKLELELAKKPTMDSGAIEDWRQDVAHSLEDQATYDRLRVAASQGLGLGDPSRTDYVPPEAVRARLQGLHSAYGGRPAPATNYDQWKEQAARMGDPRFQGRQGPAPTPPGILGAIMGTLREARGMIGDLGGNANPPQPARPGSVPAPQLTANEKQVADRLRKMPQDRQKAFLSAAMQRDPESTRRVAESLGFEVRDDG